MSGLTSIKEAREENIDEENSNTNSSNEENEEKSHDENNSRMSGPTSTLDINQNSDKRKQVKFQGEYLECNNNGEGKDNDEAERKSQDENNSRMSGFTSVLQNNSLTTNIWEMNEQQQAAEKIRKSKETKVKNTLA